ncbi:MAG TPA: outer membrane beta-barrel protein [Lacipirellulaceae bacterium]|nr:outer membrane beta-barrel protein [Lacipirellulaceae bacterium]
MKLSKLATALAIVTIVDGVAFGQAVTTSLKQPTAFTPVAPQQGSVTTGIQQPESVAAASQRIAARPALRQPEELIPPQQAGYYDENEPAAPPAAPMAPERDGEHSDHAQGAVVEGDHVGGAPCGCENGYGDCGCNNCDSGWGSCLGDCCLGDAWTLKSCLTPCCDTNYGGWFQVGYHDENNRLSRERGDLFEFNDVPDELNLHQFWFYVEDLADADCGSDWGYRVDVVYGTDAQKTQAFGNDGGTWDVTFDHGVYGWAIPQAYAEFAAGDWNAKVGHFFTIVGYEVVPATGNFFYSHAYTMFNSEPFTHTGILLTNTANDCVTWYAGWTLGWDTGFDQRDGGSNFLGGVGLQMTDDVKYTYILTAGDFGWRGEGYTHSNVLDVTLCDCWQYVVQSDYVTSDFAVPVTGFDNEDVGVNQYLFYTLNDCWKLGSRLEWWKSNNDPYGVGRSTSYYGATVGVNYRANANLVFRPEARYNWTNESAANGTADFNQTVFGVDAILTY